MATLTTYATVGTKEDLSDIITNIAVDQTPIYSMFGKEKATATYHEWLEDTLRSPKANKLVEGADYTVDAPASRTRKGNYTQIFTQAYGVTKTQEAVQKAGIKSEIAYQMAKAMKEVARDVEKAIIENVAAVAGNATTARELGGIPALVTTNVLGNSGTPRALTETLLNDGIQAAWEAGGTPDTVVVSGKQKRVISGFTAGSTKTIDPSDKKLINAVDVYESDFGIVKIIADRFMPNDKAFILSKDYWKIAYLRPFTQEDLQPQGSRMEKVIEGELTLVGRAEKANTIIKDLQ